MREGARPHLTYDVPAMSDERELEREARAESDARARTHARTHVRATSPVIARVWRFEEIFLFFDYFSILRIFLY